MNLFQWIRLKIQAGTPTKLPPSGEKTLFIAEDGTAKLLTSTGEVEDIASGAGSMSSFDLAADSGTAQTVVDADTVSIVGGTGLSTVVTAPDTVTVNLDDTAVTPASYNSANITVDAQGRITAAADGGGSGTDTTAIHDNQSGEIAAITTKSLPVAADYLLIEDTADSNNKKKIAIGSLLAVAILREKYSTGTNGGGCTASAWNARTINDEADPSGIVTISGGDFTPVVGNFVIDILSIIGSDAAQSQHKVRLYNVTQAAVVMTGMSITQATANRLPGYLHCRFAANGSDAYRIEHWISQSQITHGLGFRTNDGSDEVYVEAVLAKVP